MKRFDFKAKPVPWSSGKGIIIVLCAVISSASFLLGYFAGQKTASPPSSLPPVAAICPEVILPEQTPSPAAIPGEAPPPLTESREALTDSPRAVTNELIEEEKSREKVTKKSSRLSEKKSEADAVQDIAPAKEKKVSGIRYTVQAGAFRDEHEAEALKDKLKKKGYNSSVKMVKTKKSSVLYKVMVGDFKSKKDAEMLSRKFKAREGYRAFVTFR